MDLEPVEWDVAATKLLHYHGRPRDPDAELLGGSWEQPHEPVEDGCPGGYQLAPMVWDLHRYIRRRTKDGDRVQNPHFDRLEDDIVTDAVLYFEAEEDRAMAHWARERYEDAKERSRKRGAGSGG